METEIQVALVSAAAALLGAMVGGTIPYFTATRQARQQSKREAYASVARTYRAYASHIVEALEVGEDAVPGLESSERADVQKALEQALLVSGPGLEVTLEAMITHVEALYRDHRVLPARGSPKTAKRAADEFGGLRHQFQEAAKKELGFLGLARLLRQARLVLWMCAGGMLIIVLRLVVLPAEEGYRLIGGMSLAVSTGTILAVAGMMPDWKQWRTILILGVGTMMACVVILSPLWLAITCLTFGALIVGYSAIQTRSVVD